jgi:hypothetical protein
MTATPLVLLLAVAGANGLLARPGLDQSIKQLPARHRTLQRWQTIRVSFQVTALVGVLAALAVTVTR